MSTQDKLAEALELTARRRAAANAIAPDQWRTVLYGWEDRALQAYAAEAAQAQAQAQSGEWVMVPRKITPEMEDAADRRDDEEPPSDWGKMRNASRQAIWSAMLAAAPQPQAAEPVAYALFNSSGLIRLWSKKWFGAVDGKSCQPTPLYTHPQPPAQDAKVRFAPPETEEDVMAYLRIARLHVKRFREVLQDAMAREADQ